MSEKLCGNCCNYSEENYDHGGGGYCNITNTFSCDLDPCDYCPFYNVPKERIVVLPCKVGETVYFFIGNKIIEGYIWHITMLHKDELNICISYNDNDDDWYFSGDDFGKTVFLSYEAAEQAKEGAEK